MSSLLTFVVYISYTQIALPIWRGSVDKEVINHTSEHYEQLRKNGLVPSS